MYGWPVIYAMAVAGQFLLRAGSPVITHFGDRRDGPLQCVPTLVFVWVSSLAGLMACVSVGLASSRSWPWASVCS